MVGYTWRASHGLPPAPPLPELNLPDLLEDGAEDPDKPPEFLQDLNELSREKVLFRDAVLGQMISILIGKSKPNALLTAGSPAYQKVARMLKPALARGRIRVIGSTTSQEVRDLETDPAFNRRFTRVLVDELSAA